jgi:hypothetical protein
MIWAIEDDTLPQRGLPDYSNRLTGKQCMSKHGEYALCERLVAFPVECLPPVGYMTNLNGGKRRSVYKAVVPQRPPLPNRIALPGKADREYREPIGVVRL